MGLENANIAIVAAFFGFIALAVALLLPVYLFMKREEERGNAWNEDLRRQGRLPGQPSGNGTEGSVEGDERA